MHVLPNALRSLAHPRRGGPVPASADVDAGAVRTIRALTRESESAVDGVLRGLDADPEVKAARTWLRGEPDPKGAAITASLTVQVMDVADERTRAAFVDAWTAAHGLPFAACAFTELCASQVGRCPEHGQEWGLRAPWWDDRVMLRMRTLLAAAGDADHREAVARLAAHRTGPHQRLAASYLVPDEPGWMRECLRETGYTRHLRLGQLQILCSMTNAEQVERSSHQLVLSADTAERWPEVAATLAAEVGPAVAPMLRGLLGNCRADETAARRALLASAVELPYDETLRIVLDGLGNADYLDALHTAVDRAPERTIRLLAALADEDTPNGSIATGVLNGRAGFVSAVPDADDLPELLVAPPRIRGRAKRSKVDPELLPRILMRGRDRVLPLEATRHVLTMLALSKPGEPHAGLDTVRELCDPASLAGFSWALFAHWSATGSSRKDDWAFTQIGQFGDDTAVRRLASLIRAWPGERALAKAATGVDVLGEIGSDIALTNLYIFARKGRPKSLKARAQRKVDQVAADRGLTAEQLADRAVPDFGLAETGGRTFDYGPRRFEVGFDEQLNPYVVEASGKRRKSLPKPGAADDPGLAPAAHARFAALRKEVRSVAAEEIGRLEAAMVRARRWTPEEFAGVFARHPLLSHIVRRLVWLAEDGDGPTAFRVAEDGTYADVDDAAFVPSEGARIGVAHPLPLGDAVPAWTDLFADYEILQPFEQLARPVHVLTEAERTSRRLARLEGMKAPYGKVKGFSQGRWETRDGSWIARTDPAGRRIVVGILPGLHAYDFMGVGADQTYEVIEAGLTPESGGSLPLGDIDPVTMSEVIRDLTRIAY